MQDKTLKDKYRFRDRLLNAITDDGKFRLSILKATNLVETAREKHQLNSISTYILGELLIAAGLSTSSLKSEERISFKIESTGKTKVVVAEANAMGEIRGFIDNTQISAEGNSVNEIISSAIGEGYLKSTKILFGHSEPINSIIELQYKSVAEDLTHFYAQSEQIPSAIRIGIKFNKDGSVAHAAGFLVQAMPEATDKDIVQMEMNVTNMPPLAEMLESGNYIDEIARDVLLGYSFKELRRRPVDFFCSCNKDRFRGSLQTLGKEELKSMSEEDQHLRCHYCNTTYTFTSKEIKELL
jgi:molecular chaperone Hsp33